MAKQLTTAQLEINYKTRNWPRGPRPHMRGPRPHVWLSGPSELAHEQYTAWLKHKSQAAFRRETHDITFESWQLLWQDEWHNRGKSSDDMCLTREDPSGAWTVSNVILITRAEQIRRSNRFTHTGLKYRRKNNEELS